MFYIFLYFPIYISEFFRGFSQQSPGAVTLGGKKEIYVPSLGKFIKQFYLALAEDDAVWETQRTKWPGAPY